MVESDGVVPWVVVGADGQVVEPIEIFLREFVARGNRRLSVRSYAYDLLRWWRWLLLTNVHWDEVTSADVREYVLWLQQAIKVRGAARTGSARTAGTINPITRKSYLDDRYKPRTTRHSNAVLRSFYEFWIERGARPLVNPIPLQRSRGRRPNEHHNPLEPFRSEGRLLYNPKIPKTRPRALPDERWLELFAALRSNRDRAVLALAVSTAARAAELLGVRGVDLDWGEQLIRVRRKGTGAEQWLPASAEAFVWLRLYLADVGQIDLQDPIWWTLRRRDHGDGLRRQVMNYEALRAVLRRANTLLGTNWSMHDLRHTCALRMARDQNLSMRDVQTILGHAHLSTTADVYMVEEETAVLQRVADHLADRKSLTRPAPVQTSVGYDGADLAVLFEAGAR